MRVASIFLFNTRQESEELFFFYFQKCPTFTLTD